MYDPVISKGPPKLKMLKFENFGGLAMVLVLSFLWV
jgi:hypothetical protein